MAKIPLFRTRLSEEAIDAAVGVLRSGWLGQGAQVAAFERAFAQYIGVDHCVAVSSGTAALHLALRVLDLPEGSEVVTSPMTWVATHYAILYERCVPVLADIQPATGNIDPSALEQKITDRTRAIIAVHYCGYPCDLDEIYEIAERHQLPVIEDCAHAAGACYEGRRVGSAPTLQCFSFGPVKNLTTIHGGAITSSDGRYFQRLRALRSLGFARTVYERVADDTAGYRKAYELDEAGFRYELPDVHAAIGLAQLPHLDDENRRRAKVAAAYRDGLAEVPGVRCMEYRGDRQSAYHMYPLLVEERDRVVASLRRHEVDLGVHYPPNTLLSHDGLPAMAEFATRTLTVPMNPWVTDAEVATVIDAVQNA